MIGVLLDVVEATGAGAFVYVMTNRSVFKDTAGCCSGFQFTRRWLGRPQLIGAGIFIFLHKVGCVTRISPATL